MPTATEAAHRATDLHDPTSAAYKKARRLHLKATRNRNQDVEADWTPFRAAEKKYKARFPPPDLSDVLDLATLDAFRAEEVSRGGWYGRADAIQCTEIELNDCNEAGPSTGRKAYIFPDVPGLVLLPSFVDPEGQRRLVRWALSEQARHPNETNLDTHYVLPEIGLWNKYVDVRRGQCEDGHVRSRALLHTIPNDPQRVETPGPRRLVANEPASKDNYDTLSCTPKPPAAPSPSAQPIRVSALVPKLRWANIGWSYHWGRSKVRSVCKRAVRAVSWDRVFANDKSSAGDWGEDGPDWDSWHETYEPDAGIVNFYQTKDTLMAHVDRSEVCATSPLVSISLGCAAIFLIGGLTRDAKPSAILLRSGDAVIMSGPACRRAYHGVPRILEGTLPPHLESGADGDWVVYEEYLRNSRINVNVRQVFPRGFDPTAPTRLASDA
ncbi:uncharacterized protein B0H18DRAFT_1006549 [Fomitopsis serialis]|uniref:uncharacterized protein n=1 Tax=Fomitopsis serialis TaxID=139415 RepID=UPI002008D3B8|nr:uncharacterized protein B0H18DRAFT_1006549 [Neoantrodia serialis]KAH9926101.1 hypothetical protein B0H18DRAFT_1006549 [Neoantrodia serialis]